MARNSEIIIAENIKLDNTYKNVLSYNQTQMLNLVNTNKVASANNYSFIRQEQNMVQVGFAYSTICNANYMAFQNKDYNNKWFFAFIRDIQYVSDNCVNIIFDIDVWSTFYNDLTINKCFIEREHVNDDTIGLHTVPENIDTGEMVCESETEDSSLSGEISYYVAVYSDWLPVNSGGTGDTQKAGSQYDGVAVYNGVVGGHSLLLFKLYVDSNRPFSTYDQNDHWDSHTPDLIDLKDYIATTNADGHIEDIKDIFLIPDALFNGGSDEASITDCSRVIGDPVFARRFMYYVSKQSFEPDTYTVNIPKVHNYTGITGITNNKLFCYPYNYLLVTNNVGNQNIYKYEMFSDSTNATFETQLAVSIGVSGRTVPTNYEGVASNVDESLQLGKYPTCGWSADSFTNWLTQQSINLPTKLVTMAGGIGASIAIGNPLGAGLVAGGGALSLLNEFRGEKLKPNIEGGGNTGDIACSTKSNTFVYKCMRCKVENLKILNDYFNRFGYKINETKTPNLTGRTYWNYIKIGGNDRFATGNIQSKFLDVINQIANQGVTVWHNHANIGNFSLTNSIVTP